MKNLLCLAIVAAAVGIGGHLAAADKDKPKYKIVMIMTKAHKGGPNSLRNKVLAGKASKDELNMLVELYEELGKNTPPKGDKESWKKLSLAFADSAADLDKAAQAKDKETAVAALDGLQNSCMGCHRQHRGGQQDPI